MEDGPISALHWTQEDRALRYTSWTILAFVGSFIFLVLFIKDWETKMEADKLSRVKLPHHSGLNADPNLILAFSCVIAHSTLRLGGPLRHAQCLLL